MSRLLAASLVFLLTAAPTTTLLCRAWCDGHPTTEMCQRDADVSVTTVGSGQSCTGALATIPGVNVGPQRTAPPDVGVAAAVTSNTLVSHIMAAAVWTPGDARAGLPHTPLIIVLRI